MASDVRQLLKNLKRQGFTYERTARGHWAVYKDGQLVTTFSGTPSDHRSLTNAISYLRKAGYRKPGDRVKKTKED